MVGHWWVVVVVALRGHSWWWRDGVAGCRLAATLPLVGVKKEAGRVVCLLTWAGHDLVPVVLACRRPGVRAGTSGHHYLS